MKRFLYRLNNAHAVHWLYIMHGIKWTALPSGQRIRTRLLEGARR